jgi:hypothetical protein
MGGYHWSGSPDARTEDRRKLNTDKNLKMKKLATLLLSLITALSALAIGPLPSVVGLSNAHYIAPSGSFTTAFFSNLENDTIDLSKADFTGTVTLDNFDHVVLIGGYWHDNSGTGIRLSGNHAYLTLTGQRGLNVLGTFIDAADNNAYDGSIASLKVYMGVFDNIKLKRCGQMFQGSWGDAFAGVCFMDSVVFSNCRWDSTRGSNTEARGVFFRLGAYNDSNVYAGRNYTLGDVGMFYFFGNYNIHDIYDDGARGYIVRCWHVGLNKASNDYFHNNRHLNKTTYGTGDNRSERNQFTKYARPGGTCYYYNNTALNNADDINFWSGMDIVGQSDSGYTHKIYNNLGINIVETDANGVASTGKPKIIILQDNGTAKVDSSGNRYFPVNSGIVDAHGIKLVSTLKGIGYEPATTTPPPVVVSCPTVDTAAILKKCPVTICPPAPKVIRVDETIVNGLRSGSVYFDDKTVQKF